MSDTNKLANSIRRKSLIRTRLFCSAFFAVIAIGFLGASDTYAGFMGSDLVVVTLTDGQGHSASHGIANPFEHLPDQAKVPQHVRDMINERFELKDGDVVLGWVDSLGYELDGDPVASINFATTANMSDVTVMVSSATVSFPALNNPAASADAKVTLTDNGGAAATIETTGTNTGLFKAIFNGSSEYASKLGNGSISGGSIMFSEPPTTGPIAGSVSSIQSQFAFKLSAGDSASGMGTFTVVIPEPSTVGLLLCAFATLYVSRRNQCLL